MKCSIVLATTNRPNPKFSYLEKAILSIENALKQTDFVDQKILTVDIFDDTPITANHFKYFTKYGWIIIAGDSSGKRGYADNQLRGIECAKNEWVLVCEDDSFILSIPSEPYMDTLAYNKIEFILYNAHIKMYEDESVLDYIRDGSNYFYTDVDAKHIVLIKSILLQDNYFISLPALIARKKHLEKMHFLARHIPEKKPIETGLTLAYKTLYIDKKVGILLDRESIWGKDAPFPLTQQSLHNAACIQYWNNDETLRHSTLDKGKIWI